jgi:hypothetical protein
MDDGPSAARDKRHSTPVIDLPEVTVSDEPVQPTRARSSVHRSQTAMSGGPCGQWGARSDGVALFPSKTTNGRVAGEGEVPRYPYHASARGGEAWGDPLFDGGQGKRLARGSPCPPPASFSGEAETKQASRESRCGGFAPEATHLHQPSRLPECQELGCGVEILSREGALRRSARGAVWLRTIRSCSTTVHLTSGSLRCTVRVTSDR